MIETSRRGMLSSPRGLILIAAVAAAIVLLHFLRPVAQALLVIFGGALLAVFIEGVTSWLTDHTRFPRSLALTLVVVGVIALPVAVGWLVGPQIADQIVELRERLPEAIEGARSALSSSAWGRRLLEDYPEFRDTYRPGAVTISRVTGIFSTTAGFFAALFVILFVGIYLAAAPGRYVGGVARLFPLDRRERAREILTAVVTVLRRWLAGRLASMFAVGVLTVVGLLIAGVPLALALAVIAALLTFVPYVGPVIAAIPAMLVALVDSPIKVLWVVLIYTVVQILENYVITPLIQQRAVSLAPALLITAQILMAVLFGPLGVLFATPLAVVAFVCVQAFYVEDVLGDRTDLLGGRRAGPDGP